MNEPKEYRHEMDALHFTKEQKKALAQSLCGAKPETGRLHAAPCRANRYLRTAAVAAVLAAALTVTAGAAGVLRPVSESLAALFHMDAAETQIVDKIGRPVDASDTDNGLTITADSVIGDKNNVCIVYTLEWEDGKEPEGIRVSENGNLMMGFESYDVELENCKAWHGGWRFLDPEPGDGKITYVEKICPDQPLNGQTLTEKLGGLYIADQDGKPVVKTKGSWKLKFDLEYEDVGVELAKEDQAGKTFLQEGAECTVESLYLSPVGYQVEWTLPKAGNEELLERSNRLLQVPLSINLIDGTVLELKPGGASMYPEEEIARAQMSDILPRILPLDQVESVTVAGTVFAMK